MATKILNGIKFFLRLISCVSICMLIIIVFMQVINRNFFDHSFTWVEEVASMSMVFITYLGAAMATINNSNTRIDFFIRLLPKKLYHAVEVLDDAICIGFLVLVVVMAQRMMVVNWTMYTPALKLPVGVNYFAILLGSILMIVFYFIHMILDAKKMLGHDVSAAEEALNK